MKKVLIVAAAAGLMTLAACTPSATENVGDAENTVDANVAVYENTADVAVENAGELIDVNETDANATVNAL